MPIRSITAIALLLGAATLHAEDVTGAARATGATVTLVSEAAAIAPGETFTIAMRIQHEPGFHTYWRNPGVIGLATGIKWRLPEGFTASPIRWQQPRLTKMAAYTVWGYETDALLLIDVTAPGSLSPSRTVTLRGKASWMACAKTCCPSTGEVSVTLPVAAAPRLDPVWHARFNKVRAGLPRDLPQWTVTAARSGKGYTLTLTPSDPNAVNPAPRDVYFFAHRRTVSSNHPQKLRRVGDRYVLDLAPELNTPDEVDRLAGHVYCPTGWLRDGTATAMSIDAPLDKPE